MPFSESFDSSIAQPSPLLRKFRQLLDPAPPNRLEALAQRSKQLTEENFGKTMRLFAPLYMSNECINNCQYCGFSRDNPILRVTLEIDQVVAEAKHLAAQGFRSILLVAGEHPKWVSNGYMAACVEALRPIFSTIALEVGPMETEDYVGLVEAGSEGLVVYQETYDREVYAEMHTAGPKKKFDWRLDCPERAYEAGFRRIGIGALFGLADWRTEALGLAAHLEHLYRSCWKASFTVSFPRLRPAAGGFKPRTPFTDENLVQLICALRISFPQVGVVVSTREPAPLRDALAPIGVTMMSAGSHTEPGGYTGQGVDDLHLTIRGKRVEIDERESCGATGQFSIDDERPPEEVANRLRQLGLEPVWKDWDEAILTSPS